MSDDHTDLTCDEARASAAELALGILDGTERAAVLAHHHGCPECRAAARDLAEVADLLLALAPEAEPPAGFEGAVLERLAAAGATGSVATITDPPRRRRRSRRPLAVAAAALLLFVISFGVGYGLARHAHQPALEQAAMRTPDGETVGDVWHTGGDDAVVLVSVPAWGDVATGDGSRYTLRIDLAGGGTAQSEPFGLDGTNSSWSTTTTLPGEDIEAVSVVGTDGRVWCTGTFS